MKFRSVKWKAAIITLTSLWFRTKRVVNHRWSVSSCEWYVRHAFSWSISSRTGRGTLWIFFYNIYEAGTSKSVTYSLRMFMKIWWSKYVICSAISRADRVSMLSLLATYTVNRNSFETSFIVNKYVNLPMASTTMRRAVVVRNPYLRVSTNGSIGKRHDARMEADSDCMWCPPRTWLPVFATFRLARSPGNVLTPNVWK